VRPDRDFENSHSDEVVYTAGEVFPDGATLELVLPPSSKTLALLFSDGDRTSISGSIQYRGVTYRPCNVGPGTMTAIRFPPGAQDYPSARDLFRRLADLVGMFTGLQTREQSLRAHFARSSWFPEAVPHVPTISLRGSPTDARQLLRLLSSVCRHGLFVTELTAQSLCGLPMQLKPTLLIDQLRFGGRLRGLLGGSNQPGTYVPEGKEFLDLSFFKAISYAANDLDREAMQGALEITISPGMRGLPILDQREMARIAVDLQPQLLRYRIRNYLRVETSDFDLPDFTSEMRALARGLGTSIVDDPELANELKALLVPADEDQRAHHSQRPEVAIIFAIINLVHRRQQDAIQVRDLARYTNAVLRAKGEILEFSPEEIGCRLRAIGLFTTRNAAGKAVRLDRQTSKRAHELALQYEIPMPPGGFPGCPDCEKCPVVLAKEKLVQGVQGVQGPDEEANATPQMDTKHS
jgi:hypothetical protein